jgi:hypothetical protein
MSSLIFKRVVLPGSNLVYKLCRGVSTGHAFTSLITTMCAYITLATSVDKACSITGDTSESRQALLDSTRIGNAGDDCNIRLNSSLVTKVYDIISEESGHKIDDMRENGYIDSTNVDSRVTFLKKQFYDFSWNMSELLTNLVYPTTHERNFGHRADNLKVMIYQAPLNTVFNNQLICLILCYIICGRGYADRDLLQAQLDGRVMPVGKLIQHCRRIGCYNTSFISELRKLYYGSFYGTLSSEDDDNIFCYSSMFGTTEIDLDEFIKDQLLSLDKLIKRKSA